MAILSKVALLAGATVMMAGAARADTVKIGVLTSYSGITADAGRQADADIKIFTQKWGKTIAGHTLQYIRRDTTGPNPAVAKPRAQDLIFHIGEFLRAGQLRGMRVFLDSPMGSAVTAS